MFNEDLLNFIKENFEEDTKQIAESILNLHKKLENTINNVVEKSSELGKNRKFKEAELFLKKAEELNDISCKVNEYVDINIFKDATHENEEISETSSCESCCTTIIETCISLEDIFENTSEKLCNKKITSFKLNDTDIPAENLKDVLVGTLTFLGKLDKTKAYKLPQNTTLNKKDAVNFSFVKVKAMKKPVEIKEIGVFVETSHSNEQLVQLISAVLEQYLIPTSELLIYFA